MTLDKAECILAKARKSGDKDLSDLAIARQIDNQCRVWTVLSAMLTINMLRSMRSDPGDWLYWLLVTVPSVLTVYSIYQGRRYSKIRELFEETGPQNICDLRISSPAARRETWPQ